MTHFYRDPALRRLIEQNRSTVQQSRAVAESARRRKKELQLVIAETRRLLQECRANLNR